MLVYKREIASSRSHCQEVEIEAGGACVAFDQLRDWELQEFVEKSGRFRKLGQLPI